MADPQPSQFDGVLRRPFPEQIAYFRGKLGNLVPTSRWDDIARDAHDQAFMVAGATKADLLSDLASAVDRSIAEGQGIEAFRKDFRSIVERQGWHGWTGEGTKAGEAWRTRVIYRTNASVSYAAGRVAQLREGGFPLIVYRHSGAEHPRLHHLNWDGLVLPVDHPFWLTHSPPNGWGCGCYILGARSMKGARRLGGKPEKTLPPGWDAIDPKTGAPKGIGKGWDYAPGASVADAVRSAAEKIGKWDYIVAKAFMEAVPASRRAALARSYRELPSTAQDARRYAAAVADGKETAPFRTLGLPGDLDGRIPATVRADRDPSLFDFALEPSGVGHIFKTHGQPEEALRGQRPVTPDDFARLPAILNNASMLEPGEETDRFIVRAVIDGEEYFTLWRVMGKRRSFGLLSYWVRKAR